MNEPITIVDRGRGPQLSTSRVTVQDLFPYFQMGAGYQAIQEAIPTLSVEEIRVVERYVLVHRDELEEQERRLREVSLARRNPPGVEATLRQARAERLARQRSRRGTHGGRNGDQDSE